MLFCAKKIGHNIKKKKKKTKLSNMCPLQEPLEKFLKPYFTNVTLKCTSRETHNQEDLSKMFLQNKSLSFYI